MFSYFKERWHFPMLNDEERNNKYKRAIHKKIKVIKVQEYNYQEQKHKKERAKWYSNISNENTQQNKGKYSKGMMCNAFNDLIEIKIDGWNKGIYI